MNAKPEEKKAGKCTPSFWTSLIAGACAGVATDMILFPLDTLKTRLQSEKGLWKSGGFRGVYKGLVPVLVGSAPSSAVFFVTYNHIVNGSNDRRRNTFVHIGAAGISEAAGAVVRVPLEIIKQRKQVSPKSVSNILIASLIWKHEGFFGFYRGLLSTLSREVPFAAIQFPLWEIFKRKYRVHCECTPFEAATCGAFAGGIAGALTTPMDVIKTRVMLSEKATMDSTNINLYVINQIYNENGLKGFLKGLIPRCLWITLGGFIFFGVYDEVRLLCDMTEKETEKYPS